MPGIIRPVPARLLLVCALLGPLGCRSASTGPVPSPATEVTSAKPIADAKLAAGAARQPEGSRPRIETADACAAGSVTIADGGLCLKVPEAYTAAPPMPGMQVFEADDAPPITVRWLRATHTFGKTHADALARLSALDSNAVKGSTRDGTGSFVFAVETQPQAHAVAHAASSLHTGEGLAWCTASAPVQAQLSRDFFEACQSLMAP